MASIDRTQAPPVYEIDHIDISFPEKKYLSNGIPVYLVIDKSSELTYFQLIVKGGNSAGMHAAQAQLHSRLLLEGSREYNAEQINEIIDYHGAEVSYSSYTAYSLLSVSVLEEYLPALIPILHDALVYPRFPEERFDLQKKRLKQALINALQKNDYVAARAFKKAVLGEKHPYTRLTEINELEQTGIEHLQEYHAQQIHASNMTVVAAGSNASFIMEQLEMLLAHLPTKTPFRYEASETTEKPVCWHLPGPQQLQSSLYAGRILPGTNHPDYYKLIVTDTLLGGYFGSRLMQNLREDKGYTYGIHSYIQELPGLSIHAITTEVGATHTHDALNEIRRELVRLAETPPPIEEVHTVQLNLISQFINSLSNMFQRVDTFSRLLKQGDTFDALPHYIQHIREVSPEDIQQTAANYFLPDMLHWISVGPHAQTPK
jgi:predicted Zn-dependent peptidase